MWTARERSSEGPLSISQGRPAIRATVIQGLVFKYTVLQSSGLQMDCRESDRLSKPHLFVSVCLLGDGFRLMASIVMECYKLLLSRSEVCLKEEKQTNKNNLVNGSSPLVRKGTKIRFPSLCPSGLMRRHSHWDLLCIWDSLSIQSWEIFTNHPKSYQSGRG